MSLVYSVKQMCNLEKCFREVFELLEESAQTSHIHILKSTVLLLHISEELKAI